MKKRIVLGIAVFVILTAALTFAFVAMSGNAPEMRTATVQYGDVAQAVEVSGTIEKPEHLTLAFLSSGRIDRVDVAVGDVVAAGASLAALAPVTSTTATGETVSTQEVLTSPIDGIVTDIVGQRGEVTAAGQPMIVVESAADVFTVVAYIPEDDVARLDTRVYPATITLPAFDDVTFTGTLQRIAPAATVMDGGAFYRATLSLDGRDNDGKGVSGVRSGMSADVRIVTALTKETLVIPYRAVARDNDDVTVRVLLDAATGAYEVREVTLGLRGDDGTVAVRDGLEEGETIILSIEET